MKTKRVKYEFELPLDIAAVTAGLDVETVYPGLREAKRARDQGEKQLAARKAADGEAQSEYQRILNAVSEGHAPPAALAAADTTRRVAAALIAPAESALASLEAQVTAATIAGHKAMITEGQRRHEKLRAAKHGTDEVKNEILMAERALLYHLQAVNADPLNPSQHGVSAENFPPLASVSDMLEARNYGR
jgi:hypothetical protein